MNTNMEELICWDYWSASVPTSVRNHSACSVYANLEVQALEFAFNRPASGR